MRMMPRAVSCASVFMCIARATETCRTSARNCALLVLWDPKEQYHGLRSLCSTCFEFFLVLFFAFLGSMVD